MHKVKLSIGHPHVSVRLQFCVSICFTSKPTAGFWQKRKLKLRKAEIFLQVPSDFTACNPLYKVSMRWLKILANRRSQAHGNLIQSCSTLHVAFILLTFLFGLNGLHWTKHNNK